VVARYDYDPYGELVSESGPADTPWRFAGGHFDETTELTKFGTRYYSADLGCWSQVDPVKGSIGNPMTLNSYLFAASDPINNSDPTGRFFDISWESVGEFG
jgi:RHS repeat-associated protein